MNIIFLSSTGEKAKSVKFSSRHMAAMISLLLLVSGLTVWAGLLVYQTGEADMLSRDVVDHWQQKLEAQKQELDSVKGEAREKMGALTVRLAEIQAKMIRVEALGEHLIHVAKLEQGEFDFSKQPAVGGPEEVGELSEAFQQPTFQGVLSDLSVQLEEREQQLDILESMLVNRKIKGNAYIAGRPIERGWLSSHYGRRTDPFTGKLAWHKGVDFAGKEDSGVVTVASGVVTWSGDRHGYGNMIEVNHGDGYVTRYGHNKENLVEIGEVVRKGDKIALMGSTGRSTGPHVHFEVYRNGKAVNPKYYINRRDRG